MHHTPIHAPAPASPLDPLSRALGVLERHGHGGPGHRHFAAANGEDFCILCQLPYANLNIDCPCPHWLLGPWPLMERFGKVLEMHGLAGVLHFMLCVARAGQTLKRPYRILDGACGGGEWSLDMKVRARRWTFSMAAGAGHPLLRIRMQSRSNRFMVREFAASVLDQETMAEVVEEVTAGVRFPGYRVDRRFLPPAALP